jgi:hypothetical protein
LNAQYLAAFIGLPWIGYKDKGKIFTTHRNEVFPSQIRPEELVLAWQAGCIANDLVKQELANAIRDENEVRTTILKRGATFFVLAVMWVILHERNGRLFLNKISAETASSKKTTKRLQNYSVIALEWYVEAMSELINSKESLPGLVRTPDGWTKIKPKIQSRWKVYQLAQNIVENSLPKL